MANSQVKKKLVGFFCPAGSQMAFDHFLFIGIASSSRMTNSLFFLFCCVLSPLRLSYFLNELKLGWVINFIKFRKLSHQKAGGLECLANRFCKRLCLFSFSISLSFPMTLSLPLNPDQNLPLMRAKERVELSGLGLLIRAGLSDWGLLARKRFVCRKNCSGLRKP